MSMADLVAMETIAIATVRCVFCLYFDLLSWLQ